MLFDCHIHTHLCGHAQGKPVAYVDQAKARGINLITFTCHTPIDGHGFLQEGIRMNRGQLALYKDLVDRARDYGASLGVEVLCGIEAEVFPDASKLSSMKELLSGESFDFVLGSLHHQLPVYRRWLYDRGKHSDFEIIEEYFENLAAAVSSGYYHSMSHPDVIRIYGTVANFEPQDHRETIHRFLSALVDNDVCMEVNTSGLIKGVYQVHPDPVILEWAKAKGVRLTLGSDSHRPEQVGQHFSEVITLLRSLGFDSLSYFKAARRRDIPLSSIAFSY